MKFKIRGGFVQINAVDYPLLKQCAWRIVDGYVRGSKGSLHRIIMNAPAGAVIDHINGNALDNRRKNLRICTQRQNLWNGRAHRDGSSKYRGVCWNRSNSKWRVQIQGKTIGHFTAETDAALAYNAAALDRFGEFAKLNRVPGAGVEPARPKPANFKSAASTNFATQA